MKFSDKFIRGQLELMKPIAKLAGLDTARAFQDKVGGVLKFMTRKDVVVTDVDFDGVPGALAIPRDEVRSGVILYIHGGGYVSGGLEYAKGFASVLAQETGMCTAAFAYRLAPENPYPAQLEDALLVYRYLLNNGYSSDTVLLSGESAGGGLCFSLVMKLRELSLPEPCGIVAISPWCDLTNSGESHTVNKNIDPSLTKNTLDFYADCYVGAVTKDKKIREKLHEKTNPYISPIFAELKNMPPVLIFAGGDEILLSDAEIMHKKLTEGGGKSTLIVREEMWHAYHLYRLKSSDGDFRAINSFIKSVFPKSSERKLRWMTLDNAAKIYPAARTSTWTNVFRLSATLTENVDKKILQNALDVTVRRFPMISARIRRGAFWYYLEEIPHAPRIMEEKPYPLSRMPFDDIRSCAFRVIVYKRRVAVEFFHALTDGNGGLVFLKTLLAEYISEKYGVKIPTELGVLDRLEAPHEEELVDCFPKYAGKVSATRRESDSYRIFGEEEPDGFKHNTTFIIESQKLVDLAHGYGVTVTAALAAAFIKASLKLQAEDVPNPKKRKDVKILIPCDLRRIYNTETLRNFALYSTPGVDARLGEYSFREIAEIVSHQMKLDITPKVMASKIRTNVKDEENIILKLTPLFLKNIVMKIVFMMCGEKKSALTVSNLGSIKLPDEMKSFIERMDFVLSVQSKAPYNAGVLSYEGKTYINVIRNIKAARLERALYEVLRNEGIKVKVESNERD